MYLKAFNRSGTASNGITAGASGIITEGFSILQTGKFANLTEINFESASANPFGTDTSITGITAAQYPKIGEEKFEKAFVNADPNLSLRVEIIRPENHTDEDFGILFNRGEDATLGSNGRQTIAQLGTLVNEDDVAFNTGLATAGTVFRLRDENGSIITTDMVVTSAVAAASFAWIRIANIATPEEIISYFTDDSVYLQQADLDIVQAVGRQLQVEILTNSEATDGNGIWELYNDNGTKLASN